MLQPSTSFPMAIFQTSVLLNVFKEVLVVNSVLRFARTVYEVSSNIQKDTTAL